MLPPVATILTCWGPLSDECDRSCGRVWERRGSVWMIGLTGMVVFNTILIAWLIIKRCAWRGKAFATAPDRTPTTVYVDSMALRFISANRNAIVRVTDTNPSAFIDTVSGSIPVSVIGHAGLNVHICNRSSLVTGALSRWLQPCYRGVVTVSVTLLSVLDRVSVDSRRRQLHCFLCLGQCGSHS